MMDRPTLYVAIGERIADARASRDHPMTQRELGAAIGRCRVTIWNWENATHHPAIADLYAIAAATNRRVADLLPDWETAEGEAP